MESQAEQYRTYIEECVRAHLNSLGESIDEELLQQCLTRHTDIEEIIDAYTVPNID